jgi:hypothetical protein
MEWCSVKRKAREQFYLLPFLLYKRVIVMYMKHVN